MKNMESCDNDDVLAALDALHSALTDDLEQVEARIAAAGHAPAMPVPPESGDIAELLEARTGLHGGLASIAEVLGWFQWKIEQDAEGEVAVSIQPLPTLRGCSVH